MLWFVPLLALAKSRTVTLLFWTSMVWEATAPAATTATGLWMVCSPEVVKTKLPDGTIISGVDSNVRDFVNFAGEPLDVFKMAAGDLI